MALLSRIFQGKKNKASTTRWYTSEQAGSWDEPPFSGSQVRLVIFRDQDFKGRGLLFDSKAVHRLPESDQNEKKGSCRFVCKKPPPRPSEDVSGVVNPAQKYTFSRPGSDVKMLEEMVFGAVGMAFRGSSLKVHNIRSPNQLMLTKVFAPITSRARESGAESESLDYSLNCSSTELTSPQKINDRNSQDGSNMAHSVPMDVPSPPRPTSYSDAEPEDSGFSTSATSSLSSFAASSLPRSSSSSSLTSSSLNSMTRRWRRNQQTSLEHNILKRQSDEGVSEPVPLAKRPPKIGMAIIVQLSDTNEEVAREFQDFFFSHITLIEGLINKLKVGVERALTNRKLFIHLSVEVLELFRQRIEDLYLTPRLEEPVWLTMMCHTTRRVPLCQRFLREFMTLVSKYDSKNTKFFLSTLITGVLTHHLAWVPTVTPAGASPSRTYLDKHSAKWLDAVAKSHPYNPLWAQLGDLYGAIGFPLRLSRTIIVGRKAEIVSKFLYILSYFIRCSEVNEREEPPHDFDDFKLEDDAPELALDSHFWSDRDSISQASTSSDVHSLTASTLSKATDLISNRETVNHVSESTSGSESTCEKLLSLAYVTPVSDLSKVRLKKLDEVDSKHEGGVFSDPRGRYLHAEFQFDDSISRQRTEDFVNSVHSFVEENPTLDLGSTLSIDCDLSLTYPGAVLDSEYNDSVESDIKEELSVQSNKRIFSFKTADSNSETVQKCRLSPTRVNENPSRADIRYVGREATSQEPAIKSNIQEEHIKSRDSPMHSPTKLRNPSQNEDEFIKNAIDPSSENTVLSSPKKTISHDEGGRKEECSHDSGIYDTVVTHKDCTHTLNVSKLIAPDSGLAELSPKSIKTFIDDSELHTLTEHSTYSQENIMSPENEEILEENKMLLPEKCKIPLLPETVSFSRSSSMFDEYFSGDCEPVSDLIRNTSARTTPAVVEKFKRMASIEGGSSVFEEYMSVPCPDISSRLTEVSMSAMRTTGAFEENDTSIFDEYFVQAENLCAIQLQSSTTYNAYDNGHDFSIGTLLSNKPGAGQLTSNGADQNRQIPSTEGNSALSSFNSSSIKDSAPLFEQENGANNSSNENTQVHLAERRNAKRPDCLHVSVTLEERSRPRQTSGQSTATIVGSRTCSAAPTEFHRRRHASNLSTTSSIEADFFNNLKEVNIPSCEMLSAEISTPAPKSSFSRSLLAGFSDHYLSDFVLHGTSDTTFQAKLHNDLFMAVQSSVLDEPIAEAVCLVADMDQWSVKLNTCHNERPDRVRSQEVAPSPLVCSIIESVHDLWKLKMSPEFCLMHLEDRLQEIFFKSRTLAEYVHAQKKLDIRQIASILKFDLNDIPLLLAVAGTHSPHRNMAFL